MLGSLDYLGGGQCLVLGHPARPGRLGKALHRTHGESIRRTRVPAVQLLSELVQTGMVPEHESLVRGRVVVAEELPEAQLGDTVVGVLEVEARRVVLDEGEVAGLLAVRLGDVALRRVVADGVLALEGRRGRRRRRRRCEVLGKRVEDRVLLEDDSGGQKVVMPVAKLCTKDQHAVLDHLGDLHDAHDASGAARPEVAGTRLDVSEWDALLVRDVGVNVAKIVIVKVGKGKGKVRKGKGGSSSNIHTVAMRGHTIF